jgi:hypothetical protein
MCKEHPPHLDKWPWVAVLNPNPNEQLQVRDHALPYGNPRRC